MAFSEIHHVAIAVSDMERSVAFYRDILGFRKTLDMPLGSPSLDRLLRMRSETTGRSVILQQGVSMVGEVELVQFSPSPTTPTPAKGAGGLGAFLLSFEVRDEELEAVYQRLLKKGSPAIPSRKCWSYRGMVRHGQWCLRTPTAR